MPEPLAPVVLFMMDTIERRVRDHEIFLSFNNDSDAEMFYDWWHKEGKYQYFAYCRNPENQP